MYKVRFTKLILHAYFLLNINSITCNELIRSWFSTRMQRGSLITDLKPCYKQCHVKQRPKHINDEILKTMGHPKERKLYGSGGSVRESGFRCFSSIANSNNRACVGLKEPIELNKRLIYIVSDIKVLILAYKIMKRKSGIDVLNADSNILNNINFKWFLTVSNELRAGKFKSTRHVYTTIVKNKGKKSTIVSSPKDKVIQYAIYFMVNALYKPVFLNLSDSSRLNGGVFTSLKDIKRKFENVK